MPTNDFKAFATGNSANVISQADYLALTALVSGFSSGKASSAQVNKALRQATVMANVLAQFIADSANIDVLDDGNTAAILSNLKNSMPGRLMGVQVVTSSALITKEGANKQVISSQADSLIKISRIWADFFPANTSNQPI